jgi:arylsulfatase A-like enzyme
MDRTPPQPVARRSSDLASISPVSLILLAVSFGLVAGYLDVGIILFKKFWLNPEEYFRIGRDFAWTVPLGHAVQLAAVGWTVAAVGGVWHRGVSPRAAAWLLATLALWGALLRLPLYSGASLLLAAGLGRVTSRAIARRSLDPRRWRRISAALILVLVILAILTSGQHALGEYFHVATLPAPPPSARNVVLIVWDTVRAYNTSLASYTRDTTPKLARWAAQGVTYSRAIAPAPWTYPSHACFFTGQWPLRINAQWKSNLDTPDPTLAEFLAARGYQTAGFAANTNCCSYESGLNRGFAHYEDYALTPSSLLTRTVHGKWLLEHTLGRTDFHARKWLRLESRDAREVNDAFLAWLGRRRTDRPFFAFLNYFDAHEPYLPPRNYEGRFGIKPQTTRDHEYLFDFVGAFKDPNHIRDIVMARDCYDDCIAYLDDQLGRLLDELKRRGLLEKTVVIITSDHGEAFGEHGTIGHSYSVYLDEIFVPLVVLAPGAPVGRTIPDPASLRDLPATIVDLLGLSVGSPFPGHSLAASWRETPERTLAESGSPAFAERADETVFQAPQRKGAGIAMSLVARGRHYIRDGLGTERLFDLRIDPFELIDLVSMPDRQRDVRAFRKMLLEALSENRGSDEVERAYLRQYRQSLKSLVESDLSDRLAGAR